MDLPAHFEESRPEVLRERIRQHPLGAIVTKALVANHLPFFLKDGSLVAHVARRNPLWRDVKDGEEVLVMFGGDDA